MENDNIQTTTKYISIDKFSFSRMFIYIKNIFLLNKSSFILSFIIYFLLILLPHIPSLFNLISNSFNIKATLYDMETFTFIFNIALIYLISIMLIVIHFNYYKNQDIFTRSFLMPIKMSEKFIALFITYIILVPCILHCLNLLLDFILYIFFESPSMFCAFFTEFNLASTIVLFILPTLLFFFGSLYYKNNGNLKILLLVLIYIFSNVFVSNILHLNNLNIVPYNTALLAIIFALAFFIKRVNIKKILQPLLLIWIINIIELTVIQNNDVSFYIQMSLIIILLTSLSWNSYKLYK